MWTWHVGPRACPGYLAQENIIIHTHTHEEFIDLTFGGFLSSVAIVLQNSSVMHVGSVLGMLLVMNSSAQLCVHCCYARFN